MNTKSVGIALTIATLLLAVFFLFNSYLYNEKQDENSATAATVPGAVTMSLGVSGTISTISITPRAVVSDSRCPAGVQCVTAGTVELRVEVSDGTLSSTVLVEPNQPFDFGDYTVVLDAVEPAASQTPLQDDAYRFTFAVSGATTE
ncbi:MAG TPA: hypothetical protein VKP88_03790 [Candidatus Paceibacterota bacterium]|nr:hypothetical protein [Candidatus Paceibacterota bacterium]